MHVGVDIGGTFTDLILNRDGRLTIHKLLSTPANPADAMLAGLNIITSGEINTLTRISHGSTVATNAILERKGAKTALITTQGFRDVLFIGRQNRPVLYALHPTLPPPLIPRELCYEVPERLAHTGEVLLPLDMKALDKVLRTLEKQKVDAIAVCFLYSYLNPVHERAVYDRILDKFKFKDWQVALSSDVLPEFREYERASTVALEAYVRPVISRYIFRLEAELPSASVLRIMKSDGGVNSVERIKEQAIQTALSGPAAGVIGAFHVAKLAGYDQIITLDMGGTSTDVALCAGQPTRRPESEIDGLPLRIRMLDIDTIGAGGGSIARLDAGGALRVGPESAGAVPGPIVYGRGGDHLTVSDANAILGRLDPLHFLGGQMSLDLDAALVAMSELSDAMGLSVVQAAQGIVDVANVNIDRALRRVSIARGHDPRDFTLVAFGGAGPLHACEVAERLEIPRVLVPRYPGVLCAYGLLVADVILDYSRPVMRKLSIDAIARMRVELLQMMQQGYDDLSLEGVPDNRMSLRASLDMRYEGQAYELSVPLREAKIDMNIANVFHEIHQLTYGHALPERTVEVTNLRLQAIGSLDKPGLEAEALGEHDSAVARLDEKTIHGVDMSLLDRTRLQPGMKFAGPALVFQMDSTVYIATDWEASVDGYHNLILERNYEMA